MDSLKIIMLLVILVVILYFYNLYNKSCTNVCRNLGSKQIFCSDLDGTLIKGDITEGHKSYFMGITEYLYSKNQVDNKKYPSYQVYADEYFKRINQNDIGAFLMPYEIYDKKQDDYIAQYWEETIHKYFVTYTKNYLQQKLTNGDQVWIVSASPRIYIEPIKKYLNVTKIVAIEQDEIITYGAGKVKRVQQLTDAFLTNVQGYTADSWNNDSNLYMTLRNYNPCAELQWINHNKSTTNDVYKNFKLYNIININDYVDP